VLNLLIKLCFISIIIYCIDKKSVEVNNGGARNNIKFSKNSKHNGGARNNIKFAKNSKNSKTKSTP